MGISIEQIVGELGLVWKENFSYAGVSDFKN